MNKKSTGLLLSILGVLSLVLITAGVTYAFFNYTKEGETTNTISTGTITFEYNENIGDGNGIFIENALPMSDEKGMGDENTELFSFKVVSTVSGDANIPYTVTAKKQDGSTLADGSVKLYLTATGSEQAGDNKTVVNDVVQTFAQLPQTAVNVADKTIEKTIYTGTVPGGSNPYTENFVLKMWMNGDEASDTAIDYSPYEFVLASAATGAEALDADALITAGSFITSTDYYALPETAVDGDKNDRTDYVRVAYVNKTTRKVWTVNQAAVEGFAAGDGFDVSEQFYPLNGQKFSVKVNVYANATVVTDNKG